MAIIINTDSAIQNVPASTPTIQALGDIIFSDKFNRKGVLLGSMSDAFAGGTPQAWAGMGDSGAANQCQTFTVPPATKPGLVQLYSKTIFSHCVNAGTPNVSASMRVLSAGGLTAGQNSMIELCKAQANTGDTYRITLGRASTTGISECTLSKRIGTSATELMTIPGFNLGSLIKIDIRNGVINIYYDEILRATYTDPSPLTGTFFGFAGSSNNGNWTVTDYILRKN